MIHTHRAAFYHTTLRGDHSTPRYSRHNATHSSMYETPELVPPSPASPLAGRARSHTFLGTPAFDMLREDFAQVRGPPSEEESYLRPASHTNRRPTPPYNHRVRKHSVPYSRRAGPADPEPEAARAHPTLRGHPRERHGHSWTQRDRGEESQFR
ncbi:hypothetical protein C8Q78DRAFT_1074863 [Trametes maxima]|nr:hypothetical protein C8Q78DRAFT_1074863 [Trametes maxima]